MWTFIILGVIVAVAAITTVHDLWQTKHAILRNFPIIGHFRYWLEAIGPELRQYIVTSNNEERPFSRDQRTWVYASSKLENNYFGFGTDDDLESSPNHLIIKHAAFPVHDPHPGEKEFDQEYRIPCAKVMGAYRGRRLAFRPKSVVNVSGMSFGSLSGPAIEALNIGSKLAGCLHNTGEGGISPYHQRGGDLVMQIGTGYFGCRDSKGNFDLGRFKEVVAANPVRAVEVKLSQGAKPGVGGFLPAAKITEEISRIRGIPRGVDCASPSSHSAFHNVDEMLDFVEMLADASGVPVGIKSAVGELPFWTHLAESMARTHRGVDFITIDGGEGGTGAAPLVFADHVALPFKIGFGRVYREFVKFDLHHHVVFNGSGKLGFPETGLFAMALGCDMISVAREAMLSIGCIQAQRCHTGHCPAGVATQNRWLQRGLDPTLKSFRVANYVATLRKEMLRLSRACGVVHPSLVTLDHFDVLDDRLQAMAATTLFDHRAEWGLPSADDQVAIRQIMTAPLSERDSLARIVSKENCSPELAESST
ncbi:FMN-binding glutamate synthase family protein [Blastopirellula marina]|uniref:FMN-binding glutamate synthase family protein n=1 Tax=Blastopirellula marina TaxID=124 RepID=A0A2S8GF92_9BACT|nr:FMN-binding glutamate synthase family protein [Blastopirellula marina]PQO42960.1 FMN-binding glutamate synthase family protein [Blastopirellula marina]